MRQISFEQSGANRGNRKTRRGFVYVTVVQITAVISVIALGAIMMARTELSISSAGSDWHSARQLAMAAVENGISQINSDPDWRNNLENNRMYPSDDGMAIGLGEFRWKLIDDDGDLSNQDNDAVRVIGFGRVRQTHYVESALLIPTGSPLACLESSLHANLSMTLRQGTISSNRKISSNDNVDASNGVMVNANVEASGDIKGNTYNGTKVSGIASKDVPDRNSVFDSYVAEGTFIDIRDLPSTFSGATIQRCLISPSSNPYGDQSTNSRGIYIVDCLGADLIIRDCRIVGTLVMLNAGAASVIEDSVNWEPAIPFYPSLLVDGSVQVNCDSTPLSESSIGVNFNPTGTPSPFLSGKGSNADSDSSDSYVSRITGLLYVSDTLRCLAGSPVFDGVIVTGGEFQLDSSNVTLKYRDSFLQFPPRGFTTGKTVEIMPGSWRREPGDV